MEQVIVMVIGLINGYLAATFSRGISGKATAWRWPPSWLRMISGWLSTKALVFIVSILGCWALNIVGFTHDPRIDVGVWDHDLAFLSGWWGYSLYIAPWVLFTILHVSTVIYWKQGKAVMYDAPPAEGNTP